MIERYEPKHYEMVNSWFRDHKGDSIPEAFLSPTGFIVMGVAVGFLIQTDTNVCFLEPFISNPKAPESLRKAALSTIMEMLEKEASRLGFRYVYGVSTAPTMIEHAINRNWINTGDSKLLIKELE